MPTVRREKVNYFKVGKTEKLATHQRKGIICCGRPKL